MPIAYEIFIENKESLFPGQNPLVEIVALSTVLPSSMHLHIEKTLYYFIPIRWRTSIPITTVKNYKQACYASGGMNWSELRLMMRQLY